MLTRHFAADAASRDGLVEPWRFTFRGLPARALLCTSAVPAFRDRQSAGMICANVICEVKIHLRGEITW